MSHRVTKRKLRRLPVLFLVLWVGLWGWAGWIIRAFGTKRTIVCEHSASAEAITCRETASWFGLFPLGREKVIRAIHEAEVALSCHTDATDDEHTCAYDTVRAFTPDESVILFRRLPESEARARVTHINDFINRDARAV